MGHMLKNRVFQGANHVLGLPANPSSIGPGNIQLTAGLIRWNTGNNGGRFEYYSGNATVGNWRAISYEGTAVITKDTFTGNSTRTNYGPLAYEYAAGSTWAANILVHVGTVYQIPGTNYEFAANMSGGTDIQFISAPSTDSAITIIHGINSTTAA